MQAQAQVVSTEHLALATYFPAVFQHFGERSVREMHGLML